MNERYTSGYIASYSEDLPGVLEVLDELADEADKELDKPLSRLDGE